ncbi:MAG: histidine kinase N-terminal domain-containing protein [Anaerolineae bacterium]
MNQDNVVPPAQLAPPPPDMLARVMSVLAILADLSRADALLCVRDGEVRVLAHRRPRSIAPVHRNSLDGEAISRQLSPVIYEAFDQNRFLRGSRAHSEAEGAPVMQEVFPVRADGRLIAVLVIETNLLEHERLRRRSRVFQRALANLKWMASRGEPLDAARLSPFGEYDGIIYADADRVIRYMSGIATNLYRNIGYSESLLAKPLAFTETVDDELARQAIATGACVERELVERGRTWVKKALPIEQSDVIPLFGLNRPRLAGVVITIHDDTDARQRELELKIKTTMIKEVHHRVKNDLQTVAALLRMQGRRMQTEEAKLALAEAGNRILSIAVIHEFLSEQDSRIINIREIAGRILTQMQSGVLDPERAIHLKLKGPNILLTARQATSCALVINELLQNALEHGYDQRASGGTISLTFEDEGDRVMLRVHDDGRGLPADFDLEHVDSLGLRIVRMLVTDDLRGQIEMQSDNGVSAIVRFPKIPLGGEDGWNERES